MLIADEKIFLYNQAFFQKKVLIFKRPYQREPLA